MGDNKKGSQKHSVEGIGDKGLSNPVFPKELQRRRWSQKEVITIIYDALQGNGKLKQTIVDIIKSIKKGGEVK